MLNKRNSGIELLRLVSMYYIVLYHLIVHILDKINPNSIVFTITETIFHIGVICFVLITGYFKIKPSLKGFLKFYLICLTYNVLVYLISVLCEINAFSNSEFLNSFFAISRTSLWFVNCYATLYILSPLLNKVIDNSSLKETILYTLLLGILSCYLGWLLKNNSFIDGKNTINFIFLYFIGNIIYRISPNLNKYKLSYLIIIYLSYNMVIALSYIIVPNEYRWLVKHFFFPYNSIGLIINGCLCFFIFIKIGTTFESKIINKLALSSFAIYLLHENEYTNSFIYSKLNHFSHWGLNDIHTIFIFSLIALVIFISCIAIDQILKPIILPVHNFILDKFEMVSKKIIQYF